MASVTIPWETGTGNIIVQFSGSGNNTVIAISDTPNVGIDRSQAIAFKSLGVTPEIVVNRRINQEGLRQPYNNIEGAYLLADGSTYNVLKK